MLRFFVILLTWVFLLPSLAFSTPHPIALTMDDLPFVGEGKNFHLDLITESIKKAHIPVTGFVIASRVKKGSREALQRFHDAGLGIGNHTFSHASLNSMDTSRYLEEISQADTILAPLLTQPKYFRYPYLAMGQGQKKEQVLHFLAENNYRIAPITIDSRDFIFNQHLLATPEPQRRAYFETLKPLYLDYLWKQTLNAEAFNQRNHTPERAQILLVHANLLNAYALDDLIDLYQKNGYEFISLQAALETFHRRTPTPLKPLEEMLK